MAWRFRSKNSKRTGFYKDYRRFELSRSLNCTYSVVSVGDYYSRVNDKKMTKVKDGTSYKDSEPREALHHPFSPLTDEDEVDAHRTMKGTKKREVLVTHKASNIEITREVLQCLNSSAWLNNEVEFDQYARNHCLLMHLKCMSILDACCLFDEMSERNAVPWNKIISRVLDLGAFEEAFDMFLIMCSECSDVHGSRTLMNEIQATAGLSYAFVTINNSDVSNLSLEDAVERDSLVYGSYIAPGSYLLVINMINPSTPTALQAVKVRVTYLLGDKEVAKSSLQEWLSDAAIANNLGLPLTGGIIYIHEQDYNEALKHTIAGGTMELFALNGQIFIKIPRSDYAEKPLKIVQQIDENHTLRASPTGLQIFILQPGWAPIELQIMQLGCKFDLQAAYLEFLLQICSSCKALFTAKNPHFDLQISQQLLEIPIVS